MKDAYTVWKEEHVCAQDVQHMSPASQSFDYTRLVVLAVAIMIFMSSFLVQASLNGVIIRTTGTISLLEVTANSGSAADIQAAVDYVAAHAQRAKVHIPAGTFNFVNVGGPWRTVDVPAGIDILGAPTERDANDQVLNNNWRTVLVMPYDVPGTPDNKAIWFNLGDGSQDPNRPTRFSDIKIQGYRTINANSITEHIALTVNGIINFRIDHNCFENTAGGAVVMPAYFQYNLYCSGVVDHNRLYNTAGFDDLVNYENGNIDYGIELHRAYNGVTFDPTMDVLGHNTNYTVFIEDNYFSKWRHCISSGHGAFYVFRHNIVDQDFGHYSVDVHGLRDTQAGRAGGRGMEVYENNFTRQVDFGGLMQDGGGCGVWFNNYVDTSYYAIALYAEDYVASQTWHLADFYMWGAKGPWTPNVGYPSGAIPPSRHVVEDWNRPAFNSSNPLYPNTDPSWSIAGYKPYAYPHPLTLG